MTAELVCEGCGNVAVIAGDCPACLLLAEYGTTDLPGDVWASMSRGERDKVVDLLSRIRQPMPEVGA